MGTECVVLCGGVNPARRFSKSDPLRLDLWGNRRGIEITLRIEDLNQRLGDDLPDSFHDLLEVATYVWAADQAISRGGVPTVRDVDTFGEKWRRSFEFHLPVRQVDRWNDQRVRSCLERTLAFLTDDFYRFEFYPATNAAPLQKHLILGDGEATRGKIDQVMLFSGGLDSLSGAIAETVVQRQRCLWVSHRPTPKHNRRHREIGDLMASRAGSLQPSQVLVDVFKDSSLNKEPTQRSRSFLFVALAAAAARMAGLNSIRFFENGIVSLNLPMAEQLVGSRATRTTHPRTLAGFQELISLLGEGRFTVENPFLWETKGEIIQRIVKAGCGAMITPSVSCAHTWEASLEHPHCGTCSQCVDRRFGIIAASAEAFDPVDGYKLDIFRKSRPKEEDKILGAAYLDRAQVFSELKSWPSLLARFPEVTDALPYLGMPKVRGTERILDLYKRHAAEIRKVSEKLLTENVTAIFDQRLDDDCLIRTIYESRGLPSAPVSANQIHPAQRTEETQAKNLFREMGDHWEIVFNGSPRFTVANILGARYLNYLLHNPNKPVRAFDLEVEINAAKAEVRTANAGHAHQDSRAKREADEELAQLRADLAEAQESDNPDVAARIVEEIRTLGVASKSKAGISSDTGERARNNVRKAITALIQKLRQGSKHQKGFATHLHQCVSLGYEVLYTKSGGEEWQ